MSKGCDSFTTSSLDTLFRLDIVTSVVLIWNTAEGPFYVGRRKLSNKELNKTYSVTVGHFCANIVAVEMQTL
jgi:hypothetical protein